MKTPDYYIIVRRPAPGNIKDQVRYMSVGLGWTTNRDLAKRFDTRAQANQMLHGRPGEIVGADESGEVKP